MRAAAPDPGRRLCAVAIAMLALAPTAARADDTALHLESVMTRVTGFDQFGNGYQAQGGPTPLSPGSERATIFEPQTEIVFTQGPRWSHRVWIPVDVVSNASPHAVDVLTSASKHIVSGSLDWAATYAATTATAFTLDDGFNLENPFRSVHSGMGLHRSFAGEATIVGASVLDVYDWFNRFDIHGTGEGRTDRNGTTGAVSLTQVLTPTTIVNVNYGVTVLAGTLGNTWNSVPLTTGVRGPEILPGERVRHALVGRAAQWLPWNGALRLYYRFYADDWGIVAHSVEAQVLQRLAPEVYVGGLYRFHTQTGASFFTILAPDDGSLRVADSDLAPLQSRTIGGKVVLDLPMSGEIRALHMELEVERFVRTNDLRTNIVSCASGFRFW